MEQVSAILCLLIFTGMPDVKAAVVPEIPQRQLNRTLAKRGNTISASIPSNKPTHEKHTPATVLPSGDFNDADPPTEKELVDFLFHNYQRGARPIKDFSRLLEIEVAYSIKAVDIDERHEMMSNYGWVTLMWRDEYLNWTDTRFRAIDHVIPPAAWVWLPPVLVYNRRTLGEARELMTDALPVSLFSNGSVYYDSTGSLTTDCTLNLRYFPFDRQTCRILIGCADQMVIRCKTVGRQFEEQTRLSFVENGQWELISASCEDRSYDDPQYVNIVVEIQLTLARKPLFYFTTLIFPTIVIALLTVLVFGQPVEAGEKISLGITLLLTFTVFLLMIVEFMPPSSNTPLFAIYLNVSLGLSALSLILAVLVTNLHHSTTGSPPPHWLKVVTRADSYMRQKLSAARREGCGRPAGAGGAAAGDPLALHLMTPAAGPAARRTRGGVSFLQLQENKSRERRFISLLIAQNMITSRSSDLDTGVGAGSAPGVDCPEGGGGIDTGITPPLSDAGRLLCMLQLQKTSEEKLQRIRHEWSSVAQGLDRILLICYTIVSIVMAVLLLGIPAVLE